MDVPRQPRASNRARNALSICALSFAPQVTGDDFGAGVLGGIDVDRDGVPDVIVLESGWDRPERVWTFSGRTGAVLREDVGEPSSIEPFPFRASAISDIGDVDRDGTHDYAYDRGEWRRGGSIVVRSSRTGARLWSFPNRVEDGCCRMSIAPLGDVDGDGMGDFVIGMPIVSSEWKEAGRCVAVSGRTRAALWTIDGGATSEYFGNVRPLDDLDGDGRREFVVWTQSSTSTHSPLEIRRGKDGSLLGELRPVHGRRLRPSGIQTNFDWDADGAVDVFVGCDGCSGSARWNEELHVFSSRTGNELLQVPKIDGPRLSTADEEDFGARTTCLRGILPHGATVLVIGAHKAFPSGGLHGFASASDDVLALRSIQSKLDALPVPAEIDALDEWIHIGGALANAGDLDQDGADDLIVASTAYCISQRGVVWVLSGKTGEILFRWHRRKEVDTPILLSKSERERK